jgi:hypothetical protein
MKYILCFTGKRLEFLTVDIVVVTAMKKESDIRKSCVERRLGRHQGKECDELDGLAGNLGGI